MTTRLPRTINDLGAGAETVADLVGPVPDDYYSSSSEEEEGASDPFSTDGLHGIDYDAEIPEAAVASSSFVRELGLGLQEDAEDILLSNGQVRPTTPDPIRSDTSTSLSLDALEANGIVAPTSSSRNCNKDACPCLNHPDNDKTTGNKIFDRRTPFDCLHRFCKRYVNPFRKLQARCPVAGCGALLKPVEKKVSDQEESTAPVAVVAKPNPSDAVANALGLKRKTTTTDATAETAAPAAPPKRQRKQLAPVLPPTTIQHPVAAPVASVAVASPQENMSAPPKKISHRRRPPPAPVAMEGIAVAPVPVPVAAPAAAPVAAPAPVALTTPTPPLTPSIGAINLVAIPGAPVIQTGTCVICKLHMNDPFTIYDHMMDNHRFPESTVRDWLSFPKEHSLPRCTHTNNHYVCFCESVQPTLPELYTHLETAHGLTKVYRYVFDKNTTVFVPDL